MSGKRRGTTLLEATLALCLLAAAFATTAQMLTVCARQRQTADRQFAAQLEATNVAERIATMRYDDITPQALQAMTLTPETQAALPDCRLTVECTDVAVPDLPHKRIAIEVAWPTVSDPRRAIHLTTWKYAPPGQSP